MSAFVVPQDHIAALINAADHHARLYHSEFHWQHDGTSYILSRTGDEGRTEGTEWHDPQERVSAQTLGQMLFDTCLRSVWHRYPNDTLETLPGYMPDRERGSLYKHNHGLSVKPIAALKAIDCYEYQSCEFPEWRETCAYAFCDRLRDSLIGDLPGYEDAPWEIVAGEAETQAVRL